LKLVQLVAVTALAPRTIFGISVHLYIWVKEVIVMFMIGYMVEK
jgi:hypothetical protein